MLPCDLGAYLAVGSEAVAVAQHVVKHGVQLQLARCIFMVALDNIEAHGLRVFNDLHVGRPQLFELVDVIAVGLGDAAGGLAILTAVLVYLLLYKTRWGLLIRAVTQNREMSGAVGINQKRVDAYTFALGCGLAGIAGQQAAEPAAAEDGATLPDAASPADADADADAAAPVMP